jgi:hypothetical protein
MENKVPYFIFIFYLGAGIPVQLLQFSLCGRTGAQETRESSFRREASLLSLIMGCGSKLFSEPDPYLYFNADSRSGSSSK